MSKRMLIIVFGFWFLISTSGSLSAKVLKIGMMGPLSGLYAADGLDIKNGVTFAIEQINKEGGVPGYHKIELVSVDTACDPIQAVKAANTLINESVAGVIGAYCSSATIPASEVLAEESISMLTPASTHQDITDRGLPYIYRLCGRDDAQAPVAAKFMKEVLKAKSLFLVDDKTTYSHGLANGVKKAAGIYGIKVIGHEQVNQGERDFTRIIAKAKKLKADVFGMYLQNWVPGSLMLIQAKKMGLNSKIISGDAIYHPKLIELAGAAAENLYDSYTYIVPDTIEYKALSAKYEQRKLLISAYGVYAYDAAIVLLTAIRNSKSTKAEKIKTEIMKMDYQGASKQIKFRKNGDSGSAYVIYKIIDGKYKLYWTPSKGVIHQK